MVPELGDERTGVFESLEHPGEVILATNAGYEHGERFTPLGEAMADETSPDELLWKYLHVHGWRPDDAGFVAELAREYPDPEQWPSDLRERFDDCGLRLWSGATGAARQVEEEGLVTGPLWSAIGPDLVFQWAKWASAGMEGTERGDAQ
jgi:hypothetical protein